MYCSSCGTKNQEDDRFCVKCGKPLGNSINVEKGGLNPNGLSRDKNRKFPTIVIVAIIVIALGGTIFGLYRIWKPLLDALSDHDGETIGATPSTPDQAGFEEIVELGTAESALTLSPDSAYIAYPANEKDIVVLNTSTMKVAWVLRGHTDSIISLLFSPDGKTLASSAYDWTVILWNLQDGAVIHKLDIGDLCGLNFLDHGKTLVTDCFETRSLYYWDTETGEKVLDYFSWLTKSANIKFSPLENALLQYGFATTYVNLYDRDYVNEIGTLTFDSSSEVVQAKFLPDGKNVVAAFYDGKVGIWDINSKEPWWQKQYDEGARVDQLFVAPEKSNPYIVFIKKDGTVDLFDGISLNIRTIGNSFYTTAALSPDNRIIALGRSDTFVEIWTLDGDAPIQTLAGGQHAPPKKIIFSSTGDLLIVVPFEGETKIYQKN